MNAYLWHVDQKMRHHLRSRSIDEARERIAATHGDEIARRAVIKPLDTVRAEKSEAAAA